MSTFVCFEISALSQHSNSRKMSEAVKTCVKLCKAATYINILDSNNVIFSLVHTVIGDLKTLLFKVDKPYFRGAPLQLQDIDLLIDFFLANFRLNPHNNDTLKLHSICILIYDFAPKNCIF